MANASTMVSYNCYKKGHECRDCKQTFQSPWQFVADKPKRVAAFNTTTLAPEKKNEGPSSSTPKPNTANTLRFADMDLKLEHLNL